MMILVGCMQVESYLAADLTPHNATEAALQTGHIPSNTADVTHGPGAGSTAVRYAAFAVDVALMQTHMTKHAYRHPRGFCGSTPAWFCLVRYTLPCT